MKVLQITNNYPTDNFPAFGIFVKEQIDSLTIQGASNDVFFINGRKNGKKAYITAVFKLRKYLRDNKYDLIHCHHSFSGLVLLLSGKIFQSKTVLSYQSDPVNEGGVFFFKILNLFFDCIILKNRAPEMRYPKTVYLPNGVNIEFFNPMDKAQCRKQLGLDENKKYIIFLDSYKDRTFKRVDRFNEVIRILKEKYFRSDIEPLILTNVDRRLIPKYFCASELHLLTSDFEGSPNSVKECLACNVPVVSTPVGNVSELIGDVAGCYMSKSFEPDELAELTNKALQLSNISSRDKIINEGLEINAVALKLISIYKNLIKNKSPV